MYNYNGFLDCKIDKEGNIYSPASSVYDEDGEMVICVWTEEGYKPCHGEDIPAWLEEYLDENGALE